MPQPLHKSANRYTAAHLSSAMHETGDVETVQAATEWLRQHTDRETLIGITVALFRAGLLPAAPQTKTGGTQPNSADLRSTIS